ncbi:MAG: amidohydrolase [Ruminiclostridium sp.]|nr:amidohydrolase [Ruminiclostridium sp.]
MCREYKIIDFHNHIFPDNIAQKAVENIGHYYGISMLGQGTVEALLESISKINAERYVVHSSATHAGQVKAINDYIAGVISNYPSMIGFGTLHPGLEEIDSEVQRIIALGLRGIKLHPEFQQFFIDDESMLPVYAAIEGKLPMLIHMGDKNKDSSSPSRLARILDRFPKLVVITAHLGGYQMWDQSITHLVGRNLFMDTSSSLTYLSGEKAVEIIRRHGADKILFGTDFPMWNHQEELNKFLALGLTDAEKKSILYDNAAGLLGLKTTAS